MNFQTESGTCYGPVSTYAFRGDFAQPLRSATLGSDFFTTSRLRSAPFRDSVLTINKNYEQLIKQKVASKPHESIHPWKKNKNLWRQTLPKKHQEIHRWKKTSDSEGFDPKYKPVEALNVQNPTGKMVRVPWQGAKVEPSSQKMETSSSKPSILGNFAKKFYLPRFQTIHVHNLLCLVFRNLQLMSLVSLILCWKAEIWWPRWSTSE